MPKFRKKPVVIEAFQLTWKSVLSTSPKEEQLPDWITQNDDVSIHLTDKIENSEYALINTLEGDMRANHLDYIIMGVQGELYPCKPDIFEQSYDLA